jgi:adenylate cyclase
LGVEIERKFLVDTAKWEKVKPKSGIRIIQGYIIKTVEKTVRIRLFGDAGFITVKGETKGFSRSEYEYAIPKVEAEKMLKEFCAEKVIKTRYEVDFDGFVWEVDVFKTPRKGLILAEIELSNEKEAFLHPEWLGKEVSDNPEYFNANMI